MLKFQVKYLLTDFLIDQKKACMRLEKRKIKTGDKYKKEEIQEEINYLYGQGLQALRYNSKVVPQCVKTFYLSGGLEPGLDKINSESSK